METLIPDARTAVIALTHDPKIDDQGYTRFQAALITLLVLGLAAHAW